MLPKWEVSDIFVVAELQIGSPQISPFPPELKFSMSSDIFDIVETSLCIGRLQSRFDIIGGPCECIQPMTELQ